MLTVGWATRTGTKRDRNEDSLCVLVGDAAPPGADALLVIADGMGGHRAGEVASNLAVQRTTSELIAATPSLALTASTDSVVGILCDAVATANEYVLRAAGSNSRSGMGTTLTAVMLMRSKAFIAHVGDSSAYMVRRDSIRPLTRQHSWVGEQVAAGILTPEQASQHPRRNLITRALGVKPEVRVDGSVISFSAGETVMLTSDGVHSFVGESELQEVATLNKPQAACDLLVEQAATLGSEDDRSVIIASLNHSELKPNGRSS